MRVRKTALVATHIITYITLATFGGNIALPAIAAAQEAGAPAAEPEAEAEIATQADLDAELRRLVQTDATFRESVVKDCLDDNQATINVVYKLPNGRGYSAEAVEGATPEAHRFVMYGDAETQKESTGPFSCTMLYELDKVKYAALAPAAVEKIEEESSETCVECDKNLQGEKAALATASGNGKNSKNIDDIVGKAGEVSCKKDQETAWEACLKPLGCNIIKSAIDLSGVGAIDTGVAWLRKKMGGEAQGFLAKEGCVGSSTNSCASNIARGIFDDIWGNIYGLFSVGRAVGGWVKNKVASWFSGGDNKSSEAAHLAGQVDKKGIAYYISNAPSFAWNMVKGLFSEMQEGIKSHYGCAKWSGAPHVSECVEVLDSFRCSTCNQKINMVCGVAGFLGGEILTGWITGYGVGAAIRGGKAVVGAAGRTGSWLARNNKYANGIKTVAESALGKAKGAARTVGGKAADYTSSAWNGTKNLVKSGAGKASRFRNYVTSLGDKLGKNKWVIKAKGSASAGRMAKMIAKGRVGLQFLGALPMKLFRKVQRVAGFIWRESGAQYYWRAMDNATSVGYLAGKGRKLGSSAAGSKVTSAAFQRRIITSPRYQRMLAKARAASAGANLTRRSSVVIENADGSKYTLYTDPSTGKAGFLQGKVHEVDLPETLATKDAERAVAETVFDNAQLKEYTKLARKSGRQPLMAKADLNEIEYAFKTKIPATAEGLELIESGLKSAHPSVRIWAAEALSRLPTSGEGSGRVLAMLKKHVGSRHQAVQLAVIRAIGENSQGGAAQLTRLLKGNAGVVKQAIETSGNPVVLKRAYDSGDTSLKLAAVNGAMRSSSGATAAEAARILEDVLKGGDDSLKQVAIDGLAKRTDISAGLDDLVAKAKASLPENSELANSVRKFEEQRAGLNAVRESLKDGTAKGDEMVKAFDEAFNELAESDRIRLREGLQSTFDAGKGKKGAMEVTAAKIKGAILQCGPGK